MGNSGPFRGELGEVTEGSIRTAAIIRWPGHVKPDTTWYAMFSIMDFLPTFAHIVGGKMPTDRPIDGVDQTDVVLGTSAMGHREHLLSFIGGDLVAVRWKQWRIYFTNLQPSGIGPQREPGIFSSNAPMAGYPRVYNIQMDPHEDLWSGECLAGCPVRRSSQSRNTWSRSRSIRTRRRRTSRNSTAVVVDDPASVSNRNW